MQPEWQWFSRMPAAINAAASSFGRQTGKLQGESGRSSQQS
jgi:hypothetical protein